MHAPAKSESHWGDPPWNIDFAPPAASVPEETEFAVIGAGFSGLAAAAWLRHADPGKSVAVFEEARIGAGASGRTGGMALAESAAGDLPGLGDVLTGVGEILQALGVECELSLPSAWEIARSGKAVLDSPIDWNDSGRLRVTGEVPGGTLNPGKAVSGLARAAHGLGARIFEDSRVTKIDWAGRPVLHLDRHDRATVRAGKILFATNALSLGLSKIADAEGARLTLAIATEPLRREALQALGLAERKPFYTADLPYPWGRVCGDNSTVWGGGLVSPANSRDLSSVSIDSPECVKLLASLEARVRGLHPVLKDIRITHRWGGPILFRESWEPVFDWHPRSEKKAIVLGAFAGHGVMLSSYLGRWAAQVLQGRRELPSWGSLSR
ncbi:MAG TPA: FAD-binding oxidoreductase [Candidatus Acidoferrales bacterium]|nr:FAD-binding oxidoreductase [Candidatus Acidoferrales bacterium]